MSEFLLLLFNFSNNADLITKSLSNASLTTILFSFVCLLTSFFSVAGGSAWLVICVSQLFCNCLFNAIKSLGDFCFACFAEEVFDFFTFAGLVSFSFAVCKMRSISFSV